MKRRYLLSGLLVASLACFFAEAHQPTTAPAIGPTTFPVIPPLITVEKGNLPIILLAPHGGTEAIPGIPVRKDTSAGKFVTGGDTRSAELCMGIADAIESELGARPYVVVARFQRRFADANRKAEHAYESEGARPHWEAYHEAVLEACQDVERRFGRGIVLDVHGQRLTPDGIYRGTRNGQSIQTLLKEHGPQSVTGPDSIFGALRERGYKTLPGPEPDAIGKEVEYMGNYSMVAYGSQALPKIDGIQLEFGLVFRQRDRLDQTAKDAGWAISRFARKYLPAKPIAE